FEHMEDGIHSEMTVYVDPVLPIKYTYFKFRNRSGEARQLSLTGYVEWVLGDLRHKTMMHIITGLDHHSGAILAHNSYLTEFGQLAAFFDTNEASRMITTDRVEFIGRHGTARKPLGMLKSKLSGKTGAALDPCGVIQVHFQLAEDGEYEVLFRMGAGMQIQEVERYAREGRNRARAREVLESLKQEWKTNLSAIEIDSPDDALNFLTNGWLNYQTIACRLWARSGYYQSGGAFGFRDQLQDVMSILHTQPAWARDQILLAASRQFKQGDVQHWWHPPGGRGVRTRCSDDYLWLPHVASKYVMVTGDTGIWDEKISFLESRELNPHEHSFYDLPVQSGIQGTLYDHCIKALDNGLRFGQHGLPLIGSGDWNDGMDRVGIEGNGESTWLGWFLFDTLQKFIEAIGLKAEQNKINHYREVMDMLRKNLNTQAWDGQWYRRAYFDDGTPLGSKSNPECQIDSIAQSWAVLSGAGDATKTRSAMQEAFDMLVRKNDKIIQLLDPPFNISDPNPGYIKGYVPGVRENGGQYTHAALWMIMAYCVMRDKVKMWELLDMVNPIHHGSTKKEVSVYKVEPYVMAGDLYTESLHIGRGGWTWYTGSAGWMYQLITEYVLGLHRKGETLVISPCLPLHWDKVTVRYRYGRAVYIIDLIQVSAETDSLSTVVDDVESVDNIIHLVDDGREHAVEVNIGEAVKIG
ncbi:MAG TPA: protein ndvB, partial [Saprospiraceae bacterium]|nr:protein ndvB [Saprospiraceae bacterium]